MAENRDFNSPESQNWFKQWKAVFITRAALLPSVKSEATHLHKDFLKKASNEQTCSLDHGPVYNKSSMQCKFHDKLRDEILAIHKRNRPSWKNASTDTWRDDPFAVAKLFMQPSGYDDKSSFDEIDFNGLAAFIYNCGRFTKTVESLSDVAREYVNMIRHMPDVCSSALTDQATTECIDSMIAVLNDPYFKGAPEMVETIHRLDEIKTQKHDPSLEYHKYIIEDATIRGVQSISELASAKECGWNEHANEIKGDIEKLGGIVMSSLGEQEKNIDIAKKCIAEATEKGILTLNKATSDGKRKLNKETNKLVKIIRLEKQNPPNEGEEQTKSIFTKAKSDLQKQLINHYQATSDRINVKLDIDAAVEDIYEKPKLILKNKKDKDGKIKDEEISEINQMFLSDNGTMVKTVYVEGEPGSGKTSLCKKIAHDWCKLKQDGHEETKEDNPLSQFDFLFYVRLREVEDQCKIKEIILQCLIEQIQSDKEGSKELLSDILRTEHCLLLLDGLDEFTHCSKCKRVDRIPHVESCWMKCTTFITTRPYKLAELKLTASQIGKHVQLQGVQSPEELVRKVIKELEKDQVEKRPDTCVQELNKKGLWHFRGILIVLVHIVWLWFRNKLIDRMALYVVFREIIQERWYERCEKKNIEANELPDEFLSAVSELAYSKLFSDSEDDSIVFEIKGDQLEKFRKYKQASLESGIMSCSNRKGERSAFYQFLHKTLQEYLAALYLAKYTSNLSNDLQHIQKVYIDNRKEGVLSLGQMFKFLCGLNITAAKEFAKTLNDLFTASCERDGYSHANAAEFLRLIECGNKEAERSGHNGTDLCLQHIVFPLQIRRMVPWYDQNPTTKQMKILKQGLDKRISTLASIYIMKRSDLCDVLQHKDDQSVLDLSPCKNLKFLGLNDVSHTDINQLHLNGFLECEIAFREYTPANKLVSSFLSSDLTSLKKLKFNKFGWEGRAEEIVAKLENIEQLELEWSKNSPPQIDSQFNLGHLKHLSDLTLLEFAFSDVVIQHGLNLHTLRVSFRRLQKAPLLMAALLTQNNYRCSSNQDRQLLNLPDVSLANMLMPAEEFRRLVSMVVQWRHHANFELKYCIIEPGDDARQLEVDMENQHTLQMVPSDTAIFATKITFNNVAMSKVEFRHFVSMVVKSGRSLICKLYECIIQLEEDVKQRGVDTVNSLALCLAHPGPDPKYYKLRIKLNDVTMSAGALRHLASMVMQSGHSIKCQLNECKIQPEVNLRQREVYMKNQPALPIVAPHPTSTHFEVDLTLKSVAMSAGEFIPLVCIVLHSGHNVDLELNECTIQPATDVRQREVDIEKRPALQTVVSHPAHTDYQTTINRNKMTMSVREFRRLVSIVIQSGHSIELRLKKCTVKPEENVRQLEVEMENEPALQILASHPTFTDYKTHIILIDMTLSEREFRRLISMVILSRNSVVEFATVNCKIEPEEDVRQLKDDMKNQPANKVVAPNPAGTDYTKHIEVGVETMSAGVFRRLICMMIQSGCSFTCDILECTIETDDCVRQLKEDIEKQPISQIGASHPAFFLGGVIMSAGEFKHLVSMVMSGNSVDLKLQGCCIEPKEDLGHLEMENHPALQSVALHPDSSDYTAHIVLDNMAVSAGIFRNLICMMIKSVNSWSIEILDCEINPDEDARQLALDNENQPDSQSTAPHLASTDNTATIKLVCVKMIEEQFVRLVRMVIQSGHSLNCELKNCSIFKYVDYVDEYIMPIPWNIENESALQIWELHQFSTDNTTRIALSSVTLSPIVFRSLVSVVIHSRNSVDCTLESCTINTEEDLENQRALWIREQHQFSEEDEMQLDEDLENQPATEEDEMQLDEDLEKQPATEEDEMQLNVDLEKQPALQIGDPHPSSIETNSLELFDVTMSAGVLRRIISMIIQSGHSVKCEFKDCHIEPEEDVMRLTVEMENQPAFNARKSDSHKKSNCWCITFKAPTLPVCIYSRVGLEKHWKEKVHSGFFMDKYGFPWNFQ